jgi:hypothetical protein
MSPEVCDSSFAKADDAGFRIILAVSRAEPAIYSLRSTAGFTKGFNTLDLKEAKALLDA